MVECFGSAVKCDNHICFSLLCVLHWSKHNRHLLIIHTCTLINSHSHDCCCAFCQYNYYFVFIFLSDQVVWGFLHWDWLIDCWWKPGQIHVVWCVCARTVFPASDKTHLAFSSFFLHFWSFPFDPSASLTSERIHHSICKFAILYFFYSFQNQGLNEAGFWQKIVELLFIFFLKNKMFYLITLFIVTFKFYNFIVPTFILFIYIPSLIWVFSFTLPAATVKALREGREKNMSFDAKVHLGWKLLNNICLFFILQTTI